MSQWSMRRKILYSSFLVLFVLGFFLIFIAPSFQQEPTCQDGVQNGKEDGIDCGSGCPLYCSSFAKPLVLRWARAFPVVDGRYNAFALVENQNTDTAIHTISYEFRLYDENNIFVGRKTGTTYVPHNGQKLIVEPGIITNNRDVFRVEFTWLQTPTWLNLPALFAKENISLTASGIVMEDPYINPRLRATIQNTGTFPVYEVDVFAVLYNASGNAISASATYIEQLSEGETQDVFFTWQSGFLEDPVRIEIIPSVNPFQVGRFGEL